MTFVLSADELRNPQVAGGKAAALARAQGLARIPPFIVLGPHAFQADGLHPRPPGNSSPPWSGSDQAHTPSVRQP
jgi:hypothetical protein